MFRCQASFNSVICGECDFDVGILKRLCNKSLFLPVAALQQHLTMEPINGVRYNTFAVMLSLLVENV
jgi:hypothetical protein